jgi:hypothetical protein
MRDVRQCPADGEITREQTGLADTERIFSNDALDRIDKTAAGIPESDLPGTLRPDIH